MSRKLLHAFVTLTAFLVVWLVASPASALPNRAPVCDPRGAITFAPPPQIQDTETSLDIPADCAEIGLFEVQHAAPGRGGPVDFSVSSEPAAPTTRPLLDLAFEARLPVAFTAEARPPPGVRTSLDRPPRR